MPSVVEGDFEWDSTKAASNLASEQRTPDGEQRFQGTELRSGNQTKAFYVTKLGFRVLFEASDDGKSGILGLARGTMT